LKKGIDEDTEREREVTLPQCLLVRGKETKGKRKVKRSFSTQMRMNRVWTLEAKKKEEGPRSEGRYSIFADREGESQRGRAILSRKKSSDLKI